MWKGPKAHEVSKPPQNQSLKSLYHIKSKTSNNELQIAMLFQRVPWKSLHNNSLVVKHIVMLHNVQGMPFKGLTHNFMPHMVYSTKPPHHRWIQGQFWEDMFNHEFSFVKGANRCFGNSLGFSWLWGHFEGLEFGVQGTISRVCGDEKRSSIFGKKTKCFFS